MSFSPVEASEHITEKYKRYLKTIFSIDNEIYNNQFRNLLSDQKSLAAGPYLDVSDSFEKGKSISELIEEGILAEGFRKINIPLERPLYRHQEEAIRKVSQNNNLIVSTGIKQHKKVRYTNLLTTGKLNEYLVEIDERAQKTKSVLVKQMSEHESVNEMLKEQNQMKWVQKMNNIRNRAEEIINKEIIFR